MKYRIEVHGTGCAYALGTIGKDIRDYIRERFEDDVNDYLAAWSDDGIPEEYCAAESIGCCDDIYKFNYGYKDFCCIIIKDESGNEIFRFNGTESALNCDVEDVTIEVDYDKYKYAIATSEDGKGTWFIGEFETDAVLDPTKFCMVCKTIYDNEDDCLGTFIAGFKYDNTDIERDYPECDCGSWKGMFGSLVIGNVSED